MFTYIMTNHTNTVFYTGVTNNLARRIYEHKHNKIDSFTQRYKIYKLIWFQEFNSRLDAIQAEKMIKGWKRDKKLEMIKKENPNFQEIKVDGWCLDPSLRSG